MVKSSMVEHRVVLIAATDVDSAILEAEKLAKVYAKESSWPNCNGDKVVTAYLGACDAFSVDDQELRSGAEVYSQMMFIPRRTSSDAILDRLLGRKGELQRDQSSLFEPDFERIVKENATAKRKARVKSERKVVET
jgi:hypothetical protein